MAHCGYGPAQQDVRRTAIRTNPDAKSLSATARQFARKLIGWSANTRVLAFPTRVFLKAATYAIESKGMVVVSYSDPERRRVIDLIARVRQETEMLLDINEAYQIVMAVKRTDKTEGDIAEVGVYKGGSAKLICEAKGSRRLHLFDTFEGIPRVEAVDDYSVGQFAASLEGVRSCLEGYGDVYFYKGIFPDTVDAIRDARFSFVHLDVDTYRSTSDCLRFFYPRMNRGGVTISHDYMTVPGVRAAFDEFFRDKPEPIIEMSGSQCLIVKT
jgi:O-methyltransferase